MKRFIFGATFALTAFLHAEGESQVDSQAALVEENPEWEKLKGAAAKYVEAFNGKDAGAIAQLFAEDGEILLTEEAKLVGRDSIEQHYTRVFDSYPHAQVGLEATSVRFITPNLVMEEGAVHFTTEGEETTTHSYVALIAKQEDGTWKIEQSRNREVMESDANDELGEIEGIIGDWTGRVGEGTYKVTYRWDPSGAWISGKGRYIAPDIEPINTTIRIGWDASLEKIVSWSFDSRGGYSHSLWTKGDAFWQMKASGVNSDGDFTSSVQTVEVPKPETVIWKFSDRVIGDELPDDFELRLVKTPPKPFVKPESK